MKFNLQDAFGCPTAPGICSFGITEVLGGLIASGIAAAGVGTATAGVIGSIAAPAIIGAGTGALSSAVMGGDPGKGALMGGAFGALGGLAGGGGGGSAAPAVAGAGATPATATAVPGATGTPVGSVAPVTVPGGSGATGGGSIFGGQLSHAAGQIAGGASDTSKMLAQLMQIGAYSAKQKPQAPDPYMSMPLNPTGYLNRTQVPNYAPVGGWSTFGQNGQQPFFAGNQITGFAKGGALRRPGFAMGGQPVSSANGQHYVEGGETGQADQRPAMLSDGEYIVDAGTLSRLGDGNSNAGAQKMDELRRLIAKDAGSKKVVQNKTKSPQQYLRAVG